jgi:hypothetical protein
MPSKKRSRVQLDLEEKRKSVAEVLSERLTDASQKQYRRYVTHMENYFKTREWSTIRGEITEDRLLEYFQHAASVDYAPSTCWSIFSAIRAWLLFEHKQEVPFPRLEAFLKSINQNYEAKQAPAFSKEELYSAWRLMPNSDPRLLVQKVASMLFYFGGLRAFGDGKTLTCEMVHFQPEKRRIKVRPDKICTCRNMRMRRLFMVNLQKPQRRSIAFFCCKTKIRTCALLPPLPLTGTKFIPRIEQQVRNACEQARTTLLGQQLLKNWNFAARKYIQTWARTQFLPSQKTLRKCLTCPILSNILLIASRGVLEQSWRSTVKSALK